jgi:hypothetical protein
VSPAAVPLSSLPSHAARSCICEEDRRRWPWAIRFPSIGCMAHAASVAMQSLAHPGPSSFSFFFFSFLSLSPHGHSPGPAHFPHSAAQLLPAQFPV